MSEIVNVDNFVRAETARMLDGILAQAGGINRWWHLRGPVPLDQTAVVVAIPGLEPDDSAPSTTTGWVKLVLGLLLLAVGVRQ